ncbi:MAG: ABC transporter ATP-binding protein [Bacteroidetes bacterium]|nr:ABC transporter ATP-binding protein [Bacteroidota bacterium]
MIPPTIIRTENLRKVFKTGQSATGVINNLHCSIYKGEFTIIMGSSGSGKSTLLYLISGLENPTDGKIWLDTIPLHGRDEKNLALLRRDHVGFVFQDYNLVQSLTLEENILIAGYLGKKSRSQVREKAKELMETLGIGSLGKRLPSQVSGGEQQRFAIARALINNPHLLMADEPTGNLNSASSEKVLDCLAELNKAGQSIIMVTHDLKSACRGDRVLFLKDGEVMDSIAFDKSVTMEEREKILFSWLKEREW